MASDGQGTIYIPLDEFWAFVQKHGPKVEGEVMYGVPRIQPGSEDLEVDFAFSSDNHPTTWAKKPPAVTQWDDLKKAG